MNNADRIARRKALARNRRLEAKYKPALDEFRKELAVEWQKFGERKLPLTTSAEPQAHELR
jgi:hypothetical protein